MLDAGRAPERLGALTLFHDHADARRRYLLPDAPRLALDAQQVPQLSLLLFRSQDSGALLQFEATLAPRAADLAAAERALVAQGVAQPRLLRPDWRGGSVQLAGWLQGEALAPLALSLGPPSLVGDPGAVACTRLDAQAAALAQAALRGDALPTVLIFELDFLGLAGPLGLTVEADVQALHERLAAEGALTTPWGRARLAMAWEQAAREQLIRVRIVDESGDLEGQRAEAMRRIGEMLVARMFSPLPPPEAPPLLDNQVVAPVELSFRLSARRESLEATARWDFTERRAVSIRHHAAASLIGLLGGRPAEAHIRFADLADESAEVVLRVEPELQRLGIAALEVQWREAGDEATVHAAVLTDAEPQARFPLSAPPGPLQWRARARFDPAMTRAVERDSGLQAAEGRLIIVSARQLFPPRTLGVMLGRAELDWLDHVELRIEAPGEPPRTLLLDADTHCVQAFFAAADEGPLSVSAQWRGRGDEPEAALPPREVRDELLVLDSPFGDSIDLLLVPLPLAGVSLLSVELRTADGELAQHRSVEWAWPDRAPRQIALRRLAGRPARCALRVLQVAEDGQVQAQPWTETDATTLVIGATGPMDVRRVQVVLLGGLAGRGALAAELALECAGQRASEVLEGERDNATLALAVPESAPPATLVLREVLASGAERETRWTDPPELYVLPPVAAPG